ncbi:multiple sugar transport system substrate-binding protein [Motilibacter peucedani]|uniref:Multiple sugar transport system substrate-binding protein n=1 Tax=Motilibacter peucedani TaxID=598650 RepID=A0A420XM06_9ACTN|nr:extracellular solute-binding protein [Motilibacter peucedani]RKS71443.1 multiple sugar transport system substrate-binding protein [Motilibacter peucedani]
MKRSVRSALACLALLPVVAACGGGSGDSGGSGGASAKTGPITIWYSNNEQEVAWGKAAVDAWNTAHADQKVTGQEIPAGKSSEEVIGAAITAGNAPCLVLNTAPAAVAQFQKQGGLVPLDDFSDGVSYATARSGDLVDQYKSADGKLYQLPWKSNPVLIFYNKTIFAKAGLDPEKPALSTYDDFLATSRTLKSKGGVQAAIWPAPSSEFFQPWFDFYPLYAAATGGKQLVEDGKSTFNSPEGKGVAQFWKTMYDEGLSPREKYNGDSFAEGKAAMAIAGPWAIAAYKDKVKWGAVTVPTPTTMPADQVHTFSDAKNIAIYTACKNRQTAWEFAKFATSQEQDGKLLEMTGQMPLRKDLTTTYADYFKANPDYTSFASQAARTVEVPNLVDSTTAWQDFRDAWSQSVIFGKTPIDKAFSDVAAKIDDIAKQS